MGEWIVSSVFDNRGQVFTGGSRGRLIPEIFYVWKPFFSGSRKGFLA